jgi:hypothetical protein
MRKVMLLAAMLAMVLAAAAPVLAQDVNVETGDDVQYNAVCQNIIGAFGDITGVQAASADATAVDDSEAVAEVAQEQNVSVAQVNECLNNFATVTATSTATTTATPTATVAAKVQYGKKAVVVKGKTVTATASATSSATVSATSSASASAKSATLPETGGASLLAVGAGVLLVGGGLLARRIAR